MGRTNPKLAVEGTRRAFLKGVREGGSVSAGARAAGITVADARGWLRKDGGLRRATAAARNRALRAYEASGAAHGRRTADGEIVRPYKRLPPTPAWSRERMATVLAALRETGVLWRAAEAVGVSEKTLSEWRRDPVLGPQMDAAAAEGRAKHARPHSGKYRALLAWRERDRRRREADAAWRAMEEAPESAELPGVPGLTLGRMRREPEAFFRQVLGWEPWWKQVEVARAVAEGMGERPPTEARRHGEEEKPTTEAQRYRGAEGKTLRAGQESATTWRESGARDDRRLRRIAVRSGNGVGKTALAARVMLWVLRCWPESVVVTTAPTARQVDEILWRAARDAHRRARVPLGGKLYRGQSRWELADGRWAIGFTPEHSGPEHFQGFHAKRLLFIVDEASGVPEAHWEAIKGSTVGGGGVVLALGNPLRLTGEFFDAFHGKKELWRGIPISAFDTPNLGGERPTTETPRHGGEGASTSASDTGRPSVGHTAAAVRPIPGMVTREAVEEARADWGERSDAWRVRVLGEFPLTQEERNGQEWERVLRRLKGGGGT